MVNYVPGEIFKDEFSACNHLINWYNSVRKENEIPSHFYCGITNEPLRRKDEHKLLPSDAWHHIKTESFDIAKWVEKLMSDNKFDCGKQLGNGKEDSIFVYIYRKAPHTDENV